VTIADSELRTSDSAVWGRALSPAEVALLWAAANDATGAPPPASYANNPRAVDFTVTLTPPASAAVVLDPIDAGIVWDAADTWRCTATLTVPFTQATWDLVKDYSQAKVSMVVGLVAPSLAVASHTVTPPLVIRRAAVSRPEDTIRLDLASQASTVDDLRFDADTTYAGADGPTQIRNLILAAIPTAVFDTQATGAALPATSNAGQSRWAAVEAIADNAHLEVWQKPDGAFMIRDQPLQSAVPVDTLAVGQGGVIIESSSDFNRDTFANGYAVRAVWVESNSQTGYAYGSAFDLDPASPTRWGGPAGNRMEADAEAIQLTDAECGRLAASRLARSLGHGRGVRLSCPLRPWLYPGDPVAVELPTGGVQLHTVQRVQHDLPAMTTTVDTRLLPDTHPAVFAAPVVQPV
jgi:hypothetical protein